MPQLHAVVRADNAQETIPGELAINVTFTNRGDDEIWLAIHQASHPALVLQVRDAKEEVVLLAPPSAPDQRDLERGEPIPPGGDVSITYAGFLDRSLEAGEYRARYFGDVPSLGGRPEDPLVSEWFMFTVRPPPDFVPGVRIPGLGKPAPDDAGTPPKGRWESLLGPVWLYLTRLWCWLTCIIVTWILRRRCDQVLAQEIDEPRTETISNAPPGSEAWNGTYGWRARFLLTVDEPACRVIATIRVRLAGTITAAQRSAWEAAIEATWNTRFKLCGSGCSCCCSGGTDIVCDVQFVASGEHQVVNVGTSTTNMGNWGAADTVDVSHEVGHMLGALDEYFTVDGTVWGAGRQPSGAIMNNPANPPAARHYETVRAAGAALYGRALSTTERSAACR